MHGCNLYSIPGAVVGMPQGPRSIGVPTTCGDGNFMPGNLLVRSAHKAALHTNKGLSLTMIYNDPAEGHPSLLRKEGTG